MTLTIPDNVTAKVCVPKCGIAGTSVIVDGIKIKGIEEGNYIYFENIGSGVHTFERGLNNK